MSKALVLSIARAVYREMNEKFGAGSYSRREAILGAIDAIGEQMQG